MYNGYLLIFSSFNDENNVFYCAIIAYHVELNADVGWPQALANVQEK